MFLGNPWGSPLGFGENFLGAGVFFLKKPAVFFRALFPGRFENGFGIKGHLGFAKRFDLLGRVNYIQRRGFTGKGIGT